MIHIQCFRFRLHKKCSSYEDAFYNFYRMTILYGSPCFTFFPSVKVCHLRMFSVHIAIFGSTWKPAKFPQSSTGIWIKGRGEQFRRSNPCNCTNSRRAHTRAIGTFAIAFSNVEIYALLEFSLPRPGAEFFCTSHFVHQPQLNPLLHGYRRIIEAIRQTSSWYKGLHRATHLHGGVGVWVLPPSFKSSY